MTDVDRGAVRIGIEAPQAVDIRREEIAPADWVEAAAERRRKGGDGHA